MNGSKKELEERLAAQQKLLRDMEQSLDNTKRMIEETRRLLDEAKASGEADAERWVKE
jgi:uncharacterized coiled-coil protein SlyX